MWVSSPSPLKGTSSECKLNWCYICHCKCTHTTSTTLCRCLGLETSSSPVGSCGSHHRWELHSPFCPHNGWTTLTPNGSNHGVSSRWTERPATMALPRQWGWSLVCKSSQLYMCSHSYGLKGGYRLYNYGPYDPPACGRLHAGVSTSSPCLSGLKAKHGSDLIMAFHSRQACQRPQTDRVRCHLAWGSFFVIVANHVNDSLGVWLCVIDKSVEKIV